MFRRTLALALASLSLPLAAQTPAATCFCSGKTRAPRAMPRCR